MTKGHHTRALAVSALGAFLCGLVAVLPGPASAASSLDELAMYKGADRQARLEAGAKKEGALQVYETGTQMKPVREAFGKKYPFIRLQVYSSGSTDLVKRVTEEYKAGRHAFDIIRQPTGVLYILKDAGILRPYYSPEMEKYKSEAIEPNHHWVIDYENYLGLGFNTTQVSEADAPKTYDDLLDPKWKGKMALSDGSPSTITNWIGSLVLTKGADYVRKLSEQKFTVYRIGGRGLSNLVVSGEAALSPTIYSSHMFNSKRKGATVSWRPIGQSYALIDAVAMASKPENPHAALLYADFMMSRAAQEMTQEMGYFTARTDMENMSKPEKVLYLTERPTYAKEFEDWSNLKMKAFGRGKAPTKK